MATARTPRKQLPLRRAPHRRLRALAGALLLLPACEPPAGDSRAESARSAPATADVAPSARMASALRAAYVQAYNARDVARLAELFAADAVLIGPAGVAQGRDAVRAALATHSAQGHVALQSSGVGSAGGLAYDWGTYTLADVSAAGRDVHGDYLAIAQLEDGQARLAVLMTGIPQAQEDATRQGGLAAEEVTGMSGAFVHAYNAGDMAAVARLYADDAVLITQSGVFRGPAEIEEGFVGGRVEGARLVATQLGQGTAGGAMWMWGRYRIGDVPAPPGVRAAAYYVMLVDEDGRLAAHMTGSPRQSEQVRESSRPDRPRS